MTISPTYLAELRATMRSETLLTMVQLEQVCPGWWASVQSLADQLGATYSGLHRALRLLERRGLLRSHRINGSNAGCWLWWVKRSPDDKPPIRSEPAWQLLNLRTGMECRVSLTRWQQWADAGGINRTTARSFLYGHHETLRGEWRLISSPIQ